MFCADCNAKMYVHRTSNYKNVPYFTCSAYSKIPCGTLCPTAHRIKAEIVLNLISQVLTDIKAEIKEDDTKFVETVEKNLAENSLKEFEESKTRLVVVEKRLSELENLMCRIYEDMITDKLPNGRYETLNSSYEKEQKSLQDEEKILKSIIDNYENNKNAGRKFVNLISRYDNFENLDNFMVNEFIEKVIVHEREEKYNANAKQKI